MIRDLALAVQRRCQSRHKLDEEIHLVSANAAMINEKLGQIVARIATAHNVTVANQIQACKFPGADMTNGATVLKYPSALHLRKKEVVESSSLLWVRTAMVFWEKNENVVAASAAAQNPLGDNKSLLRHIARVLMTLAAACLKQLMNVKGVSFCSEGETRKHRQARRPKKL